MAKAIEYLQEAATLVEEIGMPGELHSKQGEEEQAYSAFERSAEIVQKLAEYIGDDGQRAHFLAMAQVRRMQEMANRSEQLE